MRWEASSAASPQLSAQITSATLAISSQHEDALAATACVARFNLGTDAVDQLAALKKASSYQRGDMIVKGGWATMPGSTDPVRGAADICVEKLMNASLKTAAITN
jgi:hypothetical protein